MIKHITSKRDEDSEERENYLDRLGAIEPQNPQSQMAQNRRSNFNEWISPERYGSDVDPAMSYTAQDNEVISWSNGDREVRRRRPQRLSPHHYIDPQLRRASSDYVHHQVLSTKRHIVEMIIHDCEIMVRQFVDIMRDERQSRRDSELTLVSAVNHYLEDIGDDILMRYDVRLHNRYEIDNTVLTIDVEMPNGIASRYNIMLDPMRPMR